ncbi:tetratricopeptide repeat protein [Capnocytophaga canimorsus]|uniref:tetratricopeptide repeat protein n=1 Tax=Capnocytophaga canimorsus TaxID=28188 RepID=UPI000589A1BF|nr:tetratricopeptide repeat protein [Capnocytophaga canimorsus]CEN48729.1 Aerotolerance-related exported protein [Capnocytophaga canimorsus]VEJ18411.1 Predicted O-linked N-acetylglucosamine transferase, SPINDLY family [Capnocytophaga canimorsus]
MKKILFILMCIVPLWTQAQTPKEIEKAESLSKKYTHQGNEAFEKSQPIEAETAYRKAISENKDNATAQFNLGNTHYHEKSYAEAFSRYKQASTSPQASYTEKQSAFHNLGNLFMQQKAYDQAVEAYKEALRNNPNDEQTRYNLAVAKEMLKKNPPQNQDKKEDKKEDNKENNKDNQDKDNQQDKNNPESDKNKDQKDKDKRDSENQQGDNDKQQGEQGKDPKQDGEENQQDNQEQDGRKRPSTLSPKQIERILEAMNQEERKVQEKVNAKKVKGRPIKSDKDW